MRAFVLLACLSGAAATLIASDFRATGDKVTLTFDHPDVGPVETERLRLAAPDYAEYTAVAGRLVRRRRISKEARHFPRLSAVF